MTSKSNPSVPIAIGIRVGFGVDIHQLGVGSPLILGGVEVESPLGAIGHSDSDVLIHAIIDALLGAVGLRDIGFHFPDSDDQYKGIDSKILLMKTYDLVKDHGYQLGNLDSTVLLETPKLSPYIPKMEEVLAETLQVDSDRISVKASTGEKLGYVGQSKGIQAYCTVLIHK